MRITRDTTDRSSEATIFLYDLTNKKQTGIAKGKYLQPKISENGNKIAAATVKTDENGPARMEIHVFTVLEDRIKKSFCFMNEPRIFIVWKFIENDRALMLFDGENFYKCNIE